MNTILFCCIGRRVRLLKDLKTSQEGVRILATDHNPFAPGLFAADKHFLAPSINDAGYIDYLINLCISERVTAITTLIDPEIEILARDRAKFIENGILPLFPSKETAEICFDKFKMFKYLRKHNISTILTYNSLESFEEGLVAGEISFPVFIKPRKGSGGVGSAKIYDMNELKETLKNGHFEYIIQEMMIGDDLDVDVYVDCISNRPVAMFSKKKLESRIGGAIKTVSFKDKKLVGFVKEVLSKFEFFGPLDMDLFYINGQYYLSEINPRFGGAYPHAFGAGVDFFQLISNNMNGIENPEQFENYEEDVMMIMYEDFIIERKAALNESLAELQTSSLEMELV